MGWGTPRRPKISTKLGNPNPREGSDGDIQIKGTALGAKLWGKWSGRWWDVPLSKDGVTKFGVTDSNYLSIDRDSVDIFTNKVKVASFGATTTVKDINLTGKINITSTGSQNVCIGTGNADVSGAEDNISIGVNAGNAIESGGNWNILIGTAAGVLVDTGDANTCIGKDAAPLISTGSANTCIGYLAGSAQATGSGGLYIGHRAEASASNVNNEGVIAVGSLVATTVGRGAQTLVIGHESLSTIYMNRDGTADVLCGIVKLKEVANSDSDVAGTGQLWVKNTDPCELWFTDDAGTDTKIV
jgi:hypothetical protein